MAEDNFVSYMKEQGSRVNKLLEEVLSDKNVDQNIEKLLGRGGYDYDTDAIEKSVMDPAWYLISQGGKRLRPVFTSLVISLFKKNPDDYIEFSIIPEVLHTATLIHDDIEDRSVKRRNVDCVHIKYGLDIALNLGDFMFYFPMKALIDSSKLENEQKIKIMQLYIEDMLKLGIGQGVDLAWHNFLINPNNISEENYMRMAFDKTGALLGFAAELGAVIGGATDRQIKLLGKFGATVGVVFQIKDDLLNIEKSNVSESKGGVGDDITEGKITLLVTHAIKEADEKDRSRLLEILKSHSSDPKLKEEASNILIKYNSDGYVEKIADSLINDVWNEVDKEFPDSHGKELIKQMVGFVLNRNF
ncbi:polyprenyl synthetase [Candidatus Mancarchaeum acidiphilum]|uniref:Polyprenyl synthetase n=1 Tax=Candidatus Mancarchaeum acidiphilum TaxID=1920749 RepID=A0A218NP62_9ARCH|nr:polyprenyl synthetase family protein [Candidatus Mancarchaeum acidiphilum]ASI14268.1 polyprenyl synthetase [Candidatus Mancarchaeum acidiphilum]